MSVHRLRREQLVARPLGEVFAFFSNAGNLGYSLPELAPAPDRARWR
jgi:hypothetical protein